MKTYLKILLINKHCLVKKVQLATTKNTISNDSKIHISFF